MRKLLWGGVAMLVLGATSVYLAADHAAKHPNTFLGRCASGAASFALTGNPFLAIQQLKHSENLPDDLVQGPGIPAEVAKPEMPPIEDGGITESEEAQQEVPELAHPIRVPETSEIEEFGVDFGGPVPIFQRGPAGEGNYEENSEYVMPPSIEMPAVMPEVVEEESSEPMIDEETLIDKVIRGVQAGIAEFIPVKPARCLGSDDLDLLEESQGSFTPRTDSVPMSNCMPTTSCMPPSMVESSVVPSSPVTTDPVSEQHETPGCNWLIRLLGLEKLFEPTPEPMTEIEPIPNTDEMQEEMPARDPNYHRYHYQGCPYSGCPYPPAYPVYPPAVEPTATPEASETLPPIKKLKKIHKSFWQRIISDCEESSCQPSVDTMECRPTDVQQFDLRRFMPF